MNPLLINFSDVYQICRGSGDTLKNVRAYVSGQVQFDRRLGPEGFVSARVSRRRRRPLPWVTLRGKVDVAHSR